VKEPEEHVLTDSCGKEVARVTVGRDRFIPIPKCDIDTVCHFRFGGRGGECPVPHSRCDARDQAQRAASPCSVLWDTDNDEEAINYDGTEPFVENGVVYIKELGCNCDPSSGSTCGGCVDHIVSYIIGESQYIWKPNKEVSGGRSTSAGLTGSAFSEVMA